MLSYRWCEMLWVLYVHEKVISDYCTIFRWVHFLLFHAIFCHKYYVKVETKFHFSGVFFSKVSQSLRNYKIIITALIKIPVTEILYGVKFTVKYQKRENWIITVK